MSYSLPRDVFLLLEDAFNHDRAKAEVFAKAIEHAIQAIQAIDEKADEKIIAKKETVKSELYNELRTELATKEFVRAEINALRTEIRAEISELRAEIAVLRTDIKQLGLLLKVLIGIAVFGLTLFNPAFVKLVELITK